MNTEQKICIIGLGYVGLPLAVEFAKKFPIDIQNKSRIDDYGPDLGAFERIEQKNEE